MSDRDRLVELIYQWEFEKYVPYNKSEIKELADHLLSNGVIVPPCKVGARVYVITSQTGDNKNLYIFEDEITHYRIVEGCTIMCFESHLGVPNWKWDDVFLTREEAEAELAKIIDFANKFHRVDECGKIEERKEK